MAKIQLGNPPTSFPATVKFTLLDGSASEIKVQFRYRTREEFAAFMDQLYPALYAAPAADAAPPALPSSMQQSATEGIGRDADHVLGALVSWDLEDELNRENVFRLADRYPAAITAITEDYRKAVTEGRAKN